MNRGSGPVPSSVGWEGEDHGHRSTSRLATNYESPASLHDRFGECPCKKVAASSKSQLETAISILINAFDIALITEPGLTLANILL